MFSMAGIRGHYAIINAAADEGIVKGRQGRRMALKHVRSQCPFSFQLPRPGGFFPVASRLYLFNVIKCGGFMKKCMMTALVICFTLAANGQTGKEKEDDETGVKESQREAQERALGGQVTENEWKDERAGNKSAGDQKTQAESAATDAGNAGGLQPEQAAGTSVGAEDEGGPGTSTVTEFTTSGSGSPAILSEKNGRDRDGTGNVQRASYNIAGAPVPGNMDLSQTNSSPPNEKGEKRIRQQEEQPQASPRAGNENGQESDARSSREERKERRRERREQRRDKSDG